RISPATFARPIATSKAPMPIMVHESHLEPNLWAKKPRSSKADPVKIATASNSVGSAIRLLPECPGEDPDYDEADTEHESDSRKERDEHEQTCRDCDESDAHECSREFASHFSSHLPP